MSAGVPGKAEAMRTMQTPVQSVGLSAPSHDPRLPVSVVGGNCANELHRTEEYEEQAVQNEVVSDINPAGRTCDVTVSLGFGGDTSKMAQLGLVQLTGGQSLVIPLGSTSIVLNSGDPLEEQAAEYLLSANSPLFYYPFDRYSIDFTVQALLLQRDDGSSTFTVTPVASSPGTSQVVQGDDILPSIEESITVQPVEAGVTLYPELHGWTANVGMSSEDGHQISVSVVFERSVAVKAMVIFIMALMWMTALCMLLSAISFTRTEEDDSYDVPALAVGLLFAMPFIRDVMPDVPTVGVSVDFLSYYWVLFLIVFATVLTIATILYRHNQAFEAAVEEEEEAERGEDEEMALAP
uniref:Uncharacterized protein n=1 Tax=Chromera velia CCMP2878 TaxID=1169474 RepID=A0A0G4G4N3_9ALVE|eukprot:Cvel_4165.t1-p1 / transcript=Cvel_4165.t1 / gene=Cvel_4165 / organism=Chromera_velia_CCMP2878 / gene_product=hypothetical protein / transcript_product=hypothetical protein / location=Cvel_scaffold179:49551-56311(-) / protein_length=350 / sequence_SO=supercontig / SO=protein_coding / is_pseudo=false